MDVISIQCERRNAVGSRQVARLRESGKVPGVVYGGDRETVNISIGIHELERELREHHRVFELEADGVKQSVYMQDVQFHVLTDEPLHIDFRRIDFDKPMQLQIALAFFGHAKGEAHGGVLVKDRHRLDLNVLPASVPYDIQVSIAALEIGDSITAGEVVLPEGVTLNMTADTKICHLVGASLTEEPDADDAAGDEPEPAPPAE